MNSSNAINKKQIFGISDNTWGGGKEWKIFYSSLKFSGLLKIFGGGGRESKIFCSSLQNITEICTNGVDEHLRNITILSLWT
jgi:hypothetical protein